MSQVLSNSWLVRTERWGLALIVLAALLVGRLDAEGEVSVSVDIDRSYLPGELVEIEVAINSSSYQAAELIAPRHPSMRLVDIQAIPIELNSESQYSQRWVALYQIARSGVIEMKAGQIAIGSGRDTESLPVSVGVLQVIDFDGAEDSDEPEPLPAEQSEAASLVWLWLIVGFVLVGVILWCRWFRSQSNSDSPMDEGDPVFVAANRLNELMDTGKPFGRELETFLAAHRNRCSDQLVDALERILYSRGEGKEGLRALIGKEFEV